MYRPATNYTGLDSFTYKVWDSPTFSNTVTVELDVIARNDSRSLALSRIDAGQDVLSVDRLAPVDLSAYVPVLSLWWTFDSATYVPTPDQPVDKSTPTHMSSDRTRLRMAIRSILVSRMIPPPKLPRRERSQPPAIVKT